MTDSNKKDYRNRKKPSVNRRITVTIRCKLPSVDGFVPVGRSIQPLDDGWLLLVAAKFRQVTGACRYPLLSFVC